MLAKKAKIFMDLSGKSENHTLKEVENKYVQLAWLIPIKFKWYSP